MSIPIINGAEPFIYYHLPDLVAQKLSVPVFPSAKILCSTHFNSFCGLTPAFASTVVFVPVVSVAEYSVMLNFPIADAVAAFMSIVFPAYEKESFSNQME